MSAGESIGPRLPPHLVKKLPEERVDLLGSSLPTKSSSGAVRGEASTSRCIGPSLPPTTSSCAGDEQHTDDSSESSDDSDDGCIGPTVSLKGGDYDVRREFASREERRSSKKDDPVTRDQWMTELPKDRTGVKIGSGPRTFSKRDAEAPVLDGGWTDTPGKEKVTKGTESSKDVEQMRIQRKRDAEIDAQLADYNAKKRTKTLTEMHRDKKRKKEKKEKEHKKEKKHKKDKKDDQKEKHPERRAFNWEEDMRVSMVDTTRAKGMLDKTLLQSRFATSKKQKYL